MKRIKPGRTARLVIMLVAVVVAGVFAVSYWQRPEPPLAALDMAYKSLESARTGPASIYLPAKLDEAEALLTSARKVTNLESRRAYFLRDYGPAAAQAGRARFLAVAADSVGRRMHDSLRVACDASIAAATGALTELGTALERMPRDPQYRRRVTRFELALATAKSLRQAQSYREAIRATENVSGDANRLRGTADTRYESWTASIGKWRRWAAETVRWSRNNQAAVIIVRKLRHTLDLYIGGREVESFSADLGAGWMGDKQHRGDNATPEGTYKITRKKGPRETKYYKALLLNYPNDEDVRSYRSARSRGSLPAGAAIGGQIEIHGAGGRGEDWTMGCVALDNRDMDRLFARVAVGTPVTIIGDDGDIQ